MGNFRETKNSAIANAARPLSWTMIARRILTIAKHSSLQRPRANSAGGHPFRLFDYGARFSAASDFDISVRTESGNADWLTHSRTQVCDCARDRRNVRRIRSATTAD